jgi:hypothetical protein
LADAITRVRVVGHVEQEAKTNTSEASGSSATARLTLASDGPSAEFKSGRDSSSSATHSRTTRRTGEERLYLNFAETGAAFREIANLLEGRRIWVLLDEWSSLPIDLQPYLADLIRRSLLPIPTVTVKLAAIEHRSAFQIAGTGGDYIGIELGADAAADINLDDFMVFDNDAERAKEFFEDLVGRHIQAILREAGDTEASSLPSGEIMRQLFTEKRAIEEFVRASEGVPRDAINILALAAQRANAKPISVQHVRVAARNWYQRDKERAASANERAQQLLHWVIDEVIRGRRARAFLLRGRSNDQLIDSLYDARVLHILKRAISSHDQPGVRYDVYKLDYGCYVDLITTAKEPQGLLPIGDSWDMDEQWIDVPPDDYRSIRRAILDLAEFYTQNSE